MGRYVLTERASADLLDIWDYIAEHDEGAADKLIDQLFDRFSLLADNPLMGSARDDLQPGLRYSVHRDFLLLYNAINDGVVIVRVVHGRRDLTSLF